MNKIPYFNKNKYNQFRDKVSEKYKRNEWITAPELRVIDEVGEQVGILSRNEALQRAREAGLDLIEVSPKATPPVARIESWSKFKYDLGKKERLAKKTNKGNTMKEMWFSPTIGEGDLEHKLKRVREFLEERHIVKLTIKIPGRINPQMGRDLMTKITEDLKEDGITEGVKFEGKNITQLIRPNK